MAEAEVVILYSTTLHEWEVWSQGRPLAHGTLENCQQAYPEAPYPSYTQFQREAKYNDGTGVHEGIKCSNPNCGYYNLSEICTKCGTLTPYKRIEAVR